MPIDVTVDHSKRLVIARAHGVLSEKEVFDYQRAVWSRPDVAGYDELADMTGATQFEVATPAGASFQSLASESAASDVPGTPTKFAVVAQGEFAFGLARMYQNYRELEPKSTKEIRVFRTLPEALEFLGIERLEDEGARA